MIDGPNSELFSGIELCVCSHSSIHPYNYELLTFFHFSREYPYWTFFSFFLKHRCSVFYFRVYPFRKIWKNLFEFCGTSGTFICNRESSEQQLIVRFLNHKWHRFTTTANGTTSLNETNRVSLISPLLRFSWSTYFSKWNDSGARNMRAADIDLFY